MGKIEPYRKVAIWFLIIFMPYQLFIALLLWRFFSSYSSEIKQWSLILSIILYGGLFFIIFYKVKSRIPSVNKVSNKRNLLSGAKYLFIRPRVPSVTIIYEDGKEKKMRLISTIRLRKLKSDILELWQEWKEDIPEKDKITQFEYPEYWRKHDIRTAWKHGIVMAIFVVLFSIFCLHSIFAPQEEINKTGNSGLGGVEIVFGIIVFFSVWGIFHARKCRRRVLCRVVVNAENIAIEYESGKTKVFKKDDIKKCSFHPFSIVCGVILKFKDGTRLENIDRVSYWPVLQDRLLGHQKNIFIIE